jgi:hypothetical protein
MAKTCTDVNRKVSFLFPTVYYLLAYYLAYVPRVSIMYDFSYVILTRTFIDLSY